MLRRWQKLTIAVGVTLGWAVVGVIPFASASRNSQGVYTLPSGNPVVSGSTISSTWANTTLSDIRSEMTNSLDRGGRGAMTAALQHSTGSCAAPSVTFSADTDVGLWRSTTNTTEMCAATTAVMKWTTTGTTAETLLTTQAGVVSTNASGSDVISATATGAASGVVGTASTTVGSYGIEGVATTQIAVSGTATSGRGVVGEATTGYAVYGLASGSGTGVVGTSDSGPGGDFVSTNSYAVKIGTGNARFYASNPSATTAFTNMVTPTNIVKAWGKLTGTTINAGFNLTSAAYAGTGSKCVTVTIGDDMNHATDYGVTATINYNPGADTTAYLARAYPVSATAIRVCAYTWTGTSVDLYDMQTNTTPFTFIVMGPQ
jgi:hypothetical protein